MCAPYLTPPAAKSSSAPSSSHHNQNQLLLLPFVALALIGLLLFLMSAGHSVAQAQDAATPPAPPATPEAPALLQPASVDEPEIRGGHEAAPGAWPWQVALVYRYAESAYSGQFCGGTLVGSEWVLTAAHCVDDSSASSIDVVLGRHKLSVDDGERISVTDIILSPDYVNPFIGADLALLHLGRPSSQTVVTLDAPAATVAEERSLNATVVGWGATDEDFDGSDVLRQVDLPLVSLDTCRSAYYYDTIADEMLCAGYTKGAKSACYGDSGGPLLIPNETTKGWTQIGIVSWGRGGCSGFNNYNVYTRVASYSEWIQSCLSNSPDSACVTGDKYEPDNDLASATLITTDGLTQTHNFDRLEDTDWLKFEAKAGVIYWIETLNLGDNSDTILWLYGEDGVTALAYNDDEYPYHRQRSLLFWEAPADGVYYLAVDNHWQYRRAETEYDIRVIAINTQVFLSNIHVTHSVPVATESPVELPNILTLLPTSAASPVATMTPPPAQVP